MKDYESNTELDSSTAYKKGDEFLHYLKDFDSNQKIYENNGGSLYIELIKSLQYDGEFKEYFNAINLEENKLVSLNDVDKEKIIIMIIKMYFFKKSEFEQILKDNNSFKSEYGVLEAKYKKVVSDGIELNKNERYRLDCEIQDLRFKNKALFEENIELKKDNERYKAKIENLKKISSTTNCQSNTQELLYENQIEMLNFELEEKTKQILDLKSQNENIINEKELIDEKNQDLLNRIREILNDNNDLNEKNKKYEYLLSLQNPQNSKPGQYYSINNGINLDYLSLSDNVTAEENNNESIINKNQENFTINMKLKIKKMTNHNYGIGRQHNPGELTKKKDILEISELMTQKPISKDPNQISNLIEFNSRDFRGASNCSSDLSEVSENEKENNERSFDRNHHDRSMDSQVSEYAVHKTMEEFTDNRFTEYESQNSVLNNLQFSNKQKKTHNLTDRMQEEQFIAWNKTASEGLGNQNQANSNERSEQNQIDLNDLNTNNSVMQNMIEIKTPNINNFNNIEKDLNSRNSIGDKLTKYVVSRNTQNKLTPVKANKVFVNIFNKENKNNINNTNNTNNMNSNISNSVNNTNNSKNLFADASVDDLKVKHYVPPKIIGNYSKEEYNSEKDDKEIVIMNNLNEESYCDNGSSFFESNTRQKLDDNYLDFQSNDFNNYYDFKIKNEFDSESKYANITKDPK